MSVNRISLSPPPPSDPILKLQDWLEDMVFMTELETKHAISQKDGFRTLLSEVKIRLLNKRTKLLNVWNTHQLHSFQLLFWTGGSRIPKAREGVLLTHVFRLETKIISPKVHTSCYEVYMVRTCPLLSLPLFWNYSLCPNVLFCMLLSGLKEAIIYLFTLKRRGTETSKPNRIVKKILV